jgi:hypothetical protein
MYVNPMRKQFEDLKAKNPTLAKYADYALANLNDVDPQEVLKALPPKYLELIRETIVRAYRLTPLMKGACEAHCYIEALILSHGVIQMCLRTLYVCAWQRTETGPLTDEQVSKYFATGHKARKLHDLAQECRGKELIEPEQEALLLRINKARDMAAHGVISGEIDPESLADDVLKAQHAALGALHRLQAWTNNPCKFYWKRDGMPLAPQPQT